MFPLLSSSASSISHLSNARYLYKTLIQTHLISTMSIALQSHAFTGNPIRSRTPKSAAPFSPSSAVETLKTFLLDTTRQSNNLNFKVLPFRSGRPLASSSMNLNDSVPIWHLGWMSLMECQNLLADSEVSLNENSMVYLGYSAADEVVYWGIEVDVSFDDKLVSEFCARKLCFVELRTLMVATDWADAGAMGELAIAGHARALLEWHKISRFCGSCGEKTIPLEGGRRKECSKESCKNRIYPRLDPVVIMLVIDRDNDRALLSRQSRFVPRMWSCLAGFIEPGESLEEAVRRETLEETGIEVGEVVYHSSQPWPVGPTSIPCQLMVGFFAHAKSLEINVDKGELEEAQWHSREDVKAALASADYRSEQRRAAMEVDQMCRGVERGRNPAAVSNVESGEAAPMFIPGPFAIAHHLMSSWVYQGG